jgi:uncharacterized protein YbcI
MNGPDDQSEPARMHEDPRETASVNTLRDISRAMVRLYKEQFGRGPESVSTHYSGPDIVVSILGNTLSPVERSMREMGKHQSLRDIRVMFQHATEPQFREAVERITGRRVLGFMSGIDVDHDLSCEVFTLEPAPPRSPSS